MENEEGPQRPEAATHPSVRPQSFSGVRERKREGEVGGERREETVESSLRLIAICPTVHYLIAADTCVPRNAIPACLYSSSAGIMDNYNYNLIIHLT